jgi:hypothetical protein
MECKMNRVESIIFDDIISNNRKAVFEDYEVFCDNENFFNDIEHNEIICSVEELKSAVILMNNEFGHIKKIEADAAEMLRIDGERSQEQNHLNDCGFYRTKPLFYAIDEHNLYNNFRSFVNSIEKLYLERKISTNLLDLTQDALKSIGESFNEEWFASQRLVSKQIKDRIALDRFFIEVNPHFKK